MFLGRLAFENRSSTVLYTYYVCKYYRIIDSGTTAFFFKFILSGLFVSNSQIIRCLSEHFLLSAKRVIESVLSLLAFLSFLFTDSAYITTYIGC